MGTSSSDSNSLSSILMCLATTSVVFTSSNCRLRLTAVGEHSNAKLLAHLRMVVLRRVRTGVVVLLLLMGGVSEREVWRLRVTRTTRHTKLNSKSPTPTTTTNCVSEPKRRRTAAHNATRNTLSLLKLNQLKPQEDEDSRDDSELDEKLNKVEDELNEKSLANGVAPLTVDTSVTEVVASVAEKKVENLESAETTVASGSDKAASLSPEMVSEGVNVLSVKQFYKKPKFLENNLGIEEDPKLGEIVQKVTSANDSLTAAQTESTQINEADDIEPLIFSDNDLANGEQENEAVTMDDVVEGENTSKLEEPDEDDAYCGRLIIEEEEEDEEESNVEEDEEEEAEKKSLIKEKAEKEEEEEEEEEEKVKNKKTSNVCDKIEAKLKQKKAIGEKKRVIKAEIAREQNNSSDGDLNSDDCEVMSMINAELKKLKKNKHEADCTYHLSIKEEEQNDAESNHSDGKQNVEMKNDDATSIKSEQSSEHTDTNSWKTLDMEHDEETLREKEKHLQSIGLLTHKEAEKKRLAFIQSSAAAVEAATANVDTLTQQRNTNKRNGKTPAAAAAAANSASVPIVATTVSTEYTGTLKTVIKLNRNISTTVAASSSTNGCATRKNQTHTQLKEQTSGNNIRRQPLKMTFQKGRARGHGHTDRSADAQSHGEDAYYTIQNENEGGPKQTTLTQMHVEEHANLQTHGRKSYNRSNNQHNSCTNNQNSNQNHTTSKGGVYYVEKKLHKELCSSRIL